VGSIGAGNAATALSQMVGKKINMTVPEIHIVPLKKVPEMLGGADNLVAGIYTRVLDDAVGGILLVFPRDSALSLADMLVGREVGSTKALSEMDRSSLIELGNILSASFLNAMAKLLSVTLIPSVPDVAFDMAGSVVDFMLIQLSNVGKQAIVLDVEFIEAAAKVRGHFFLLPDPKSLEVILESLGVHGGR
jgi:chemotaxis protein CheC